MQIELEAERMAARDFALDCVEFIEGKQTPGAARAKAEHDRLVKQNKEARRRALCGADPLNVTGQRHAKPARKMLAADPIERVGNIVRTLPSVRRLRGKNKLDQRQHMAAETYRDAFERVRAPLGGSMDFNGRVQTRYADRSPTEACLLAAETLKEAKNLLGSQSIIIIESIVCDGRGIEECARKIYGISDDDKITARDVNYVGRRLREALTELADLWHPQTRRPRMQGYRPAQGEMVSGDAGVRNVGVKPFVMR
ncbi:hypothetical protein [Nitrobacter sp. TKz-YC01]|uniref:hypothetical protein n=1 Tax=Nitrobacter sp. TKz-YC01 TaxID=3398703 RepID=UPI003A1002E5